MFCCQAIPTHGFRGVLKDTFAVGIHVPKAVLRVGVALLGRQTVPAHGFRGVLDDASALGVHGPEDSLRLGEALLGG